MFDHFFSWDVRGKDRQFSLVGFQDSSIVVSQDSSIVVSDSVQQATKNDWDLFVEESALSFPAKQKNECEEES
jgi:hypothetical protein